MSNPPSNNPLELSTEEMRALGYQVIDLIVEHFETLREQPVVRPADRPTMESRLRHPAPQEGMDASEVLEQLRRDALENILHVDHPRMFGFVPSPSNFVGVMADALGIGLNIFTGSWIGAPGP